MTTRFEFVPVRASRDGDGTVSFLIPDMLPWQRHATVTECQCNSERSRNGRVDVLLLWAKTFESLQREQWREVDCSGMLEHQTKSRLIIVRAYCICDRRQ